MGKREDCINRAKELAFQYQNSLVGCAHCSLSATLDALREYGVELVSPEVQDELFKAVIGLTGGAGNTHIGTCGAVFGSSFALSLATGVGREEQEKNGKQTRWISYYKIKNEIGDKFMEKYGSIICRDILLNKYGMAFDSQYPGRNKELFHMAEKKGCRNPAGCTISLAAGLATGAIWDIVHNPDEDLSWVWKEHEPAIDL